MKWSGRSLKPQLQIVFLTFNPNYYHFIYSYANKDLFLNGISKWPTTIWKIPQWLSYSATEDSRSCFSFWWVRWDALRISLPIAAAIGIGTALPICLVMDLILLEFGSRWNSIRSGNPWERAISRMVMMRWSWKARHEGYHIKWEKNAYRWMENSTCRTVRNQSA